MARKTGMLMFVAVSTACAAGSAMDEPETYEQDAVRPFTIAVPDDVLTDL